MTDPNYAHVILIVDRSGSMADIRADAEGGVNTFLREQAALPGRMTVTVVQFDHEVETVVSMVPVADVPPYQMRPRGWTALYDAVGYAITDTGERLAALPEDQRPGKVLVAIVTDGKENKSQDWTLERVRAAIAHQRDAYGWVFSFQGAEDSAWQGREMGVGNVQSFANTGVGTASAYSSLSYGTQVLRGGGGFTYGPDPQ